MGEYSHRYSVTDLLLQLKWDSLESRGVVFQLKHVHKMLINQVGLDPNTVFSPGTYPMTRNSISFKIMPHFRRVDVIRFSFFHSIIPV